MGDDSAVLIAVVRPSLLGTYGDGGNAIVLERRLELRGIGARLLVLDGQLPVPRSSGVIVIGGGEDDAQAAVALDGPLRASIRAAIDAGASLLGVCAGLQLLGERFATSERDLAGFDIIDCTSDRLPTRAVGEIVTRSTLPGVGDLTGFENHRGRTVLGPNASPLGTVVVGVGNGSGGVEGAVAGGVYATYLHGPVLARNPALADALLARVVGPMATIDDDHVDRLRAERLGATLNRRPRRWRWRRT